MIGDRRGRVGLEVCCRLAYGRLLGDCRGRAGLVVVLFGGGIALTEPQFVLPAGDMELRSVSWSLVLSPGRWMCYLAVVTVFLFFCFDPKYSFFVLFFFFFYMRS